jgi:hypothetical protein
MYDLAIADMVVIDWGQLDATFAEVAGRVVTDFRERKKFGLRKYGTTLQAFNGRNWRMDLYEELLDAAVYARQGMAEVRVKSGPEYRRAQLVYHYLLRHLVIIRQVLDDAEAKTAD